MKGRTNCGISSTRRQYIQSCAVLKIVVPVNSTVTVTNNIISQILNESFKIYENSNYDTYIYRVKPSQFGLWTVTANYNNKTVFDTILIYELIEYNLTFEWGYGVFWDRSASTNLKRLGLARNFNSPTPATENSDGFSPFDNIYPWSEIKEFNIINDELSYESGVDINFSRTDYDTVVRIPKFWYKVVVNGQNKDYSLFISDTDYPDFSLHPAFEGKDYIYVGKYLTGTDTNTRSGLSTLTNIGFINYRTRQRQKGAHWDMINVMVYSALQMLYLVEYANFNSQSVIGTGRSATGKVSTGGTDSINYHTGYASNSQIKYRNIEDLWGNVWQWCDGINFSGTTAYYCLDRSKYASNTSTNYTKYIHTLSSGDRQFPKNFGYDPNAPWLFLPILNGGSSTTYLTDGWWGPTSGWKAYHVGGSYGDEDADGIFAHSGIWNTTNNDAFIGSRLIWIPDN